MARVRLIAACLAVAAVCATAVPGMAAMNVTMDPGYTWYGYMNVFELDNTFLWGSAWGLGDLTSNFSGDQLELVPNTNCYAPGDTYWVNPDGSGNKIMSATTYVEDLGMLGQTVNFSALVQEDTLVDGYTAIAFIKVLDPAAGYAAIAEVTTPLVDGQSFDLTLDVPATSTLIPQFGFMLDGVVANPETVASLGHAVIVPEPSTIALLAIGGFALLRRRSA